MLSLLFECLAHIDEYIKNSESEGMFGQIEALAIEVLDQIDITVVISQSFPFGPNSVERNHFRLQLSNKMFDSFDQKSATFHQLFVCHSRAVPLLWAQLFVEPSGGDGEGHLVAGHRITDHHLFPVLLILSLFALELTQTHSAYTSVTELLDVRSVGLFEYSSELLLQSLSGERPASVAVLEPIDRIDITQIGLSFLVVIAGITGFGRIGGSGREDADVGRQ